MYKYKVKIWKHVPKKVCGTLLEKYKHLKNDYYYVIFFDKLEEMYDWYDKKYGKYDPVKHDFNGLCKYEATMYFEDKEMNNFIKYSNTCGYILYCFDDYGAGTMAHEVAHAVTFYFNHRIDDKEKIFEETNVSEYNELFAYITGSVCSQVNKRYYDILKKKKELE